MSESSTWIWNSSLMGSKYSGFKLSKGRVISGSGVAIEAQNFMSME